MTTFHVGEQTHRQVLPQPAALESAGADNPEGGDETACGLPASPGTGVEHGRGETGPGGTRLGRRHPEGVSAPEGAAREGHVAVFVLDAHGHPLDPCHPARARRLPASGRAVVARHTPFVVRLKDRTRANFTVQGVTVGIGPGSKHTGIAVFTEHHGSRAGKYAIQLDHRGATIRDRLAARATYRRSRRSRNLRYRAPRWALWRALTATRLPVATASGGRTKWNRSRTGASKSHTLDALHVGELEAVTVWPSTVLVVRATGRGTYCRTRTDKYGFPRLRLPRIKQVKGFATGDLVRAVVPSGKKAGVHTGRVAVRSNGSFNITTRHGTVQGIGHRQVRLLQRADGYGYGTRPEARRRAAFPPGSEGPGFHAGGNR
ncbi:RRXRR domain-containing protein [Streptosporangium sp. CA-115845]|uniref:RRXRR domain-containing protein n=1 Tax=Streptosporangium sp. CA-115845 TaxID=3240071 RepID=UPI003D8F5F33